MDSVVSTYHSVDLLMGLLQKYSSSHNKLGIVIAYRAIGKLYREESRFDDAIRYHREGLRAAIKMIL